MANNASHELERVESMTTSVNGGGKVQYEEHEQAAGAKLAPLFGDHELDVAFLDDNVEALRG